MTKRKSRPFTSRSCFGEISDGCSVVKDGFHVEQVCCVVKVSDIGGGDIPVGFPWALHGCKNSGRVPVGDPCVRKQPY